MSWNYRLVERVVKLSSEDARAVYYQVAEVFYKESGEQSGHAFDFGGLVGESIEDLRADLDLILEAFKKPIIKEKDLK